MLLEITKLRRALYQSLRLATWASATRSSVEAVPAAFSCRPSSSSNHSQFSTQPLLRQGLFFPAKAHDQLIPVPIKEQHLELAPQFHSLHVTSDLAHSIRFAG